MKNHNIKHIFFGIIIVALTWYVFLYPNQNNDVVNVYEPTLAPAIIEGNELIVEIVKTPERRSQGLSLRTELLKDTGMFFVFDKPGVYSFWMKDMNFAIDMIWFDENFTVTYIQEDARPESYPQSFGPTTLSQYVLEVESGYASAHNIKIGSIIKIENL